MIRLASTSPTRQSLLKNAGLAFTAVKPDVDERQVVLSHPDWLPVDIAVHLAEAKALDISARYPADLVIGADQTLVHEGRIFSKPTDIQDCRRQLLELRGNTHELISSVVCARNGASVWSATEIATLRMRRFTDEFLEHYLRLTASDCTSTVGGYKIEGPGIQLFDLVEGDHTTILGLPLLPLLAYLRASGELLA